MHLPLIKTLILIKCKRGTLSKNGELLSKDGELLSKDGELFSKDDELYQS